MKAPKNLAALLTAEGSKPAEVLIQLLGGQDTLNDLPYTTMDAIINTAFDPSATPNIRTLAYQILNTGQATSYSEKYLDRLAPCVALDLSNEDKELGLLALTSLFAIVKDTQLVPLFRNTTFLDALKVGIAHESVIMRQTISEVVGRVLPRLMSRLEQPTVMSGTFPSMVDAQRFRQEARDAASDLVKKLWEGCEDADDGVSGTSFAALEDVLVAGSPRLLSSEMASFFNQPDSPPPTATMQDLCTTYFKMGIARLPRLLIRFSNLGRPMRRGAIGTLSHLIYYLLLDSTNMYGIYLPPAGDKTVTHAVPAAAVRWSSSPSSAKQVASEWLHLHVVPLAQGTEPGEALAAASWGIELLHISALRPYRKNLAQTFIEVLLRLPGLTQLRSVRPFARQLNDSQAAMVVYAVSALKWLSLSFYESIVPRLLQAIRWIENDSCRASCVGEVVSLILCDVQRNGRMQDSWVFKALLSNEWLSASMAEEGAQFREEFLTAVILSLLKLAPIVFLPIGLQVKLGNLLETKITHDLSYYSRISSVTRITRKAISRPTIASQQQLPRSSSDVVPEPFWVQNCGRWVDVSLYCLEKASQCANWTTTSSAYSPFSLYVTLLSLAATVLLSPMRERLDLRPEEMEDFRETLKRVLNDILSFKLVEGVAHRPLRLKVLRILAHYVACMGSDQESKEQAATGIIRFLSEELTNQETVSKWKEDMSSRRYRGMLGGGKVTELPSAAESLARAKVAMHCLQQVALNVKSVAPQVIDTLKKSIANVDQSTSAADFFFRDHVLTTMANIRACLGATNVPVGKRTTPKSAQNGLVLRSPSPTTTGAGPLSPAAAPSENNKLLEDVLLTEPVLLPSMEADGRVIYRHDRIYQYWMKVYTALTIRLNRLIKTVNAQGTDERVSASSLFKRMNASIATAVTGGSDPIHLILDHSIPPNSNQLTITARAYNATNCKIDRLQLQLVIRNSRQARIGMGQRNVVDFKDANLEPGACFEATFQVDVIRFGDVPVAVDVIFPGVEVEAEDLDVDELDDEEEEGGERTGQGADNGAQDGPEDRLGIQAARNVTLRSAPLTIPFVHFLCPALDYELLLPSFQDLWCCLPFAHALAVETDPSTIRGIQKWLASQQSTLPPSAGSISGTEYSGGEEIVRLMEAAPLYGNELLGFDRQTISLREQARVTNKVRRVPSVAGSFFSEAWLFRTWSNHTVAAVLTGTALPGMVWRGRLEIRCNDHETFEQCVMDPAALRRFSSFLTNGLFHVDKVDAFFLTSPSSPSLHRASSLGGNIATGALLSKWQQIANNRKILGLT